MCYIYGEGFLYEGSLWQGIVVIWIKTILTPEIGTGLSAKLGGPDVQKLTRILHVFQLVRCTWCECPHVCANPLCAH